MNKLFSNNSNFNCNFIIGLNNEINNVIKKITHAIFLQVRFHTHNDILLAHYHKLSLYIVYLF